MVQSILTDRLVHSESTAVHISEDSEDVHEGSDRSIDSDIEPDDLSVNSSEDEETDETNTGSHCWSFEPTSHYSDIHISTSSTDDFLLNTAKEEMKTIGERFANETMKNISDVSFSDVLNIFFRGLLDKIRSGANAGVRSNASLRRRRPNGFKEGDVSSFIRKLFICSHLGQTHTQMENPVHKMALSEVAMSSCAADKFLFRDMLTALGSKQKSSSTAWSKPIEENPTMRDCEKLLSETCRDMCFVKDVSILSVDDDLNRLRSNLCREFGLKRIKIDGKGYGPVNTGCVSLTSSLVLSMRVSAMNESLDATVKTLITNLYRTTSDEEIRGSNLVAMDRGYWSESLADWMIRRDFQVVGTHKRSFQAPFVYDFSKKAEWQRSVAKSGTRSLDVAKRNIGSRTLWAMAYRSGKGNVALMYFSMHRYGPRDWCYIEKSTKKRNPSPCPVPQDHRLLEEALAATEVLTTAQGGTDWHVQRVGHVTGTVAEEVLRTIRASTSSNDEKVLLDHVGITIRDDAMMTEPELTAMTNEALRKKAQSLGLSKQGNKASLVQRILNQQRIDNLSDSVVAGRLMKRWFLKPHNSKNQDTFSIGLLNEKNISNHLSAWLEANCDNVRMIALRDVGLHRRRDDLTIAASSDGLAVLQIDSVQQVIPLEYKTMTKVTTEDEARLRSRLHTFPEGRKFCRITLGDPNFKKLVWTPGYRVQLLHNAALWSAKRILFVCASQTSIIYAVLVEFPSAIMATYMQAIRSRSQALINWYNSNDANLDHNPFTTSNLEMGYANDMNCVNINRNLARKIRELNEQRVSRDEELLRPAQSIIPQAIRIWNRVKGGQDVVSRILKNVKVDFKQLSPSAFMILRVIMTAAMNAHLTWRILEILPELGSFQSYDKLKNALNEKRSFQTFLLVAFLQWDVHRSESRNNGTSSDITNESPCIHRALKSPKGHLSKRTAIFNTPQYTAMRTDKNNHIRMRVEQPKRGKSCLVCGAETTVYCSKCDQHLCVKRKVRDQRVPTCWEHFHNAQTIVSRRK